MQARNENRGISIGLGVGPSGGNMYGHTTHGPMQYAATGPVYSHHSMKDSSMAHTSTTNTANDLAQAFAGVNIQGLNSMGPGLAGNQGIAANNVNPAALNNGQASNQVYYRLPDGRLLVSSMNTTQGGYQQGAGAYSLTPAQAQYLQQASYHVNQPSPNTPQSAPNWMASRQVSTELPDLAAPRRNSWSSNEENGPHTPFFGARNQAEYQPKVVIPNQSPYIYGTPSPESMYQAFFPQQLAKTSNGQYTYMDLDVVCQQHPAIPRPVPAIFSGEKGRGTLEKSLVNAMNTTNVYIRGLLPDTTDEMLHSYGSRFGDIVSAKSMLDQHTQLCKGFGFIKYHNFVDGENCIRGFFHWGYEAKWARVSHNEKLKTLGDPENTNLYVSNLPADMNEAGLKEIFEKMDFNVCSHRILRDPNGLTRGVGFARFETPEICDRVIESFQGKPIGHQGAQLNIRYADTNEQKKLKTLTAERRQFKTNEYNSVVYGPSSPYMQSPLSATFPSPLQIRVPGTNGFWSPHSPASPLCSTQFQMSSQPMASAAVSKPLTENFAPSSSRYSSRIKIESPIVSTGLKRSSGDKTCESSPLTSSEDDGPVCNHETRASSEIFSTKSSPSKSAV